MSIEILLADIISVGEYIAKLAGRILAHEEIEDADKLVIQKEYLTKSAWRVPLGSVEFRKIRFLGYDSTEKKGSKSFINRYYHEKRVYQ